MRALRVFPHAEEQGLVAARLNVVRVGGQHLARKRQCACLVAHAITYDRELVFGAQRRGHPGQMRLQQRGGLGQIAAFGGVARPLADRQRLQRLVLRHAYGLHQLVRVLQQIQKIHRVIRIKPFRIQLQVRFQALLGVGVLVHAVVVAGQAEIAFRVRVVHRHVDEQQAVALLVSLHLAQHF